MALLASRLVHVSVASPSLLMTRFAWTAMQGPTLVHHVLNLLLQVVDPGAQLIDPPQDTTAHRGKALCLQVTYRIAAKTFTRLGIA